MSLSSYRFAVEALEKNGVEIDQIFPASEVLITALEGRLKVSLPISYKAVFAEYGILGFGGQDFYGLGKTGLEGRNAPSVVFATELSRRDGEISNSMLRIKASGYGPFFVIDCAERDQFGESPIYELQQREMECGTNRVAESFGDFVLAHVDEYLKYIW